MNVLLASKQKEQKNEADFYKTGSVFQWVQGKQLLNSNGAKR